MRESNYRQDEYHKVTRERGAYDSHRDGNRRFMSRGIQKRYVNDDQYPRRYIKGPGSRSVLPPARRRGSRGGAVEWKIRKDPEGFKKTLDEELGKYMAGN